MTDVTPTEPNEPESAQARPSGLGAASSEPTVDQPARGVADLSFTRGKYNRRQALLLLGLGIALGLLGWSQRWFRLDGVAAEPVSATGTSAVPALLPLVLAALAAVIALLLAGRLARRILGGLLVVIGLLVAVLAVGSNPVDALRAPVEQATSITGAEAIRSMIETGQVAANHFIKWCTVVAGLLITAAGVHTIRTGWKWPMSGRKYSTTKFEPVDGAITGSAVDQWDALTAGDDPTTDSLDDDAPASDDDDAPSEDGSDGPHEHQ